MAGKKVTYKEPASYFTPAMKKAAQNWEKSQAAKNKAPKPSPKKK